MKTPVLWEGLLKGTLFSNPQSPKRAGVKCSDYVEKQWKSKRFCGMIEAYSIVAKKCTN
jgi:hypothetical protein